ncbi:MAG TPA: polyphosphate:AMP phosphotransferase [Vicinamibacteria bacterium]|nr:polyphosphate:AMP phosphotransferase [Vicinamibacteria bacterium]
MFEAAELGQELSKQEYDEDVPRLRAELLEAQFQLRETRTPVIVVIAGVEGAGKGETVNRLLEWLDPRGLETHAFGPPLEEEQQRPPYWRFWRTLPGRGRIGIFFGSWYTAPIVERVLGGLKKANFEAALSRIAFFERMQADDGALILKFWFHLSKDAQRKRLAKLERRKATAWRVTPTDWKFLKLYDRFAEVSERAIRRTDAAQAPWILVEARDRRYRELLVARALLRALRQRLEQPDAGSSQAKTSGTQAAAPTASILDRVDLSRELSAGEYDRRLAAAQERLGRLSRAALERKVSSVVVFEGWDAAGKGSAIRRITAAMDARHYQVVPVAAPTDEERAHHYLWRFWRRIPPAGLVTIFDRSWYGRVLVERVEGFAREDEWRRAYLEINDFEEQLADSGAVVTKFWVHIGRDEQLARFQAREGTAYKRHKITAEDWRNRERWDAYVAAVDEMVARTSNAQAPWVLVAGNDKRFARVQVVETLCKRLAQAL